MPTANASAPRRWHGEARKTTHATGRTRRDDSALTHQRAITLEQVLARLERVRKSGAGYSARCPAHEDRTASLSVAVGNDGRILAHCFAGCSTHDLLAAIGLTVGDLFPRRLADSTPEKRRELQGLALRAQLRSCANLLDSEAGVVLIAAGDLHRGCTLSDEDHARLVLAVERIHAARVAIGGAR